MGKVRGNVTYKQRRFVEEYIKTKGNGQQAAMRTYNPKNENVARNIASTNLIKPNVKEELETQLQRRGLQLSDFTTKLSQIASSQPSKGYSGADIIDAVKTGLKLHGVLTDKRQVTSLNITADLSKLSEHELMELRTKKQRETDMILADSS